MAVYDLRDRQNNNIWWGGGRGGGILDLIGQALIQPMIMRDAMARQYKYQLRLDDAEREYNEANRQKFAAGVRQTPGFVSGSDLMYAYGPSIGYNGNVADITAALMPRQLDTNTGDTIVSRTLLPDGSESTRTTFNIGMSPQEAGALALAQRNAEFEEQMARDKNAREWALANAQIAATRGGGKASDPYAGINAWGKFLESLGGGENSNGSGMPGLTIGPDGTPVISTTPNVNGQVAGILPLVLRGVEQEYARLYGVNPFISGQTEPSASSPNMDDDIATLTPKPVNNGAGRNMSYEERIGMNPRGWNRIPASVGTAQPSSETVRQHARNRGISYEEALQELTQ